MITATEFRKLDKSYQIHLVVFSGRYLWYRHAGDCVVYLYYLDGLFVEVFHVKAKGLDVMVNVFVGRGPLEYYLDEIDLKFLMD